MYMWSVFVRIQTVCAGYFYPTGDEPKVTRDVGPNITGGITGGNQPAAWNNTQDPYGAFENDSTEGRRLVSEYGNGVKIVFNASQSSSIYGSSTTVQPSALRALPCIKL